MASKYPRGGPQRKIETVGRPAQSAGMAFTEDDRQLLDLEARFYRHAGAKDAAIRDELELTTVRFGQRLIQLLGEPRAWLYAPATMAKVERIVEAKRQWMAARRAS